MNSAMDQTVMDSERLMKIGMRGYSEVVEYNWHGVMLAIRYMLTYEEELELIDSIVESCIVDDDGDEPYVVPGRAELALRMGIVAKYAMVELPDSDDDSHALLYYSDLYDAVLACANEVQTENIIMSVKQYLCAQGDVVYE